MLIARAVYIFNFVRMKGLEPPRLTAPDPKSGAATNYATSAFLICGAKISQFYFYIQIISRLFFRLESSTAQFKIIAQIKTLHIRIQSQLLRSTGLKDIARKEQVSPVADGQGLMHVVVGD